MKTERHGRPFRRGRLFAAVAAAMLSTAAASAPAQDGRAVVQIGDGELSKCGAPPGAKSTSEQRCLRGRVRTVTTEARGARAEGGAPYFVGRDTYDERGNLTLAEVSDGGDGPGPAGLVFRRGVNSYDEQGRMTGSKWYEAGSDEPQSIVAYTYDGRGNRVRIESRRTKPDAHLVLEYSYDAEGREVGGSVSRLTPEGWQTSKSRKVTAVEGGLTVVRSYSADGAPRGRVEVLRDARGNTLGEEVYDADARGEERLRLKITYAYDERGLLREVVYHKADAWLGSRAVYEYDGQGNCTSLTRYKADGTFAVAVERRYEYDAAGNWVAFVSFSRSGENSAPVLYTVVRRQITYY